MFDLNCPMDKRRSNSLVITSAICKCHTFSWLFVPVQSPSEAMHIICLHASFSICSYQIILYHRRQFDTQLTNCCRWSPVVMSLCLLKCFYSSVLTHFYQQMYFRCIYTLSSSCFICFPLSMGSIISCHHLARVVFPIYSSAPCCRGWVQWWAHFSNCKEHRNWLRAVWDRMGGSVYIFDVLLFFIIINVFL